MSKTYNKTDTKRIKKLTAWLDKGKDFFNTSRGNYIIGTEEDKLILPQWGCGMVLTGDVVAKYIRAKKILMVMPSTTGTLASGQTYYIWVAVVKQAAQDLGIEVIEYSQYPEDFESASLVYCSMDLQGDALASLSRAKGSSAGYWDIMRVCQALGENIEEHSSVYGSLYGDTEWQAELLSTILHAADPLKRAQSALGNLTRAGYGLAVELAKLEVGKLGSLTAIEKHFKMSKKGIVHRADDAIEVAQQALDVASGKRLVGSI